MEGEDTAAISEQDAQDAQVVQIIMQEDGQAIMPEGQFIQLNTEDGMQYIQLTTQDGENQLLQIGPDGQGQLVQVVGDEDDGTQMTFTSDLSGTGQIEEQGTGLPVAMETNEGEVALTDAGSVSAVLGDDGADDVKPGEILAAEPEPGFTEQQMELSPPKVENIQISVQKDLTEPDTVTSELPSEVIEPEPTEEDSVASTAAPSTVDSDCTVVKETETKRLDLQKPIQLTSETVVMVSGKKCVLRVDPSTNELVAYPVKPEPGKRPRGRPRKVPKLEPTDGEKGQEDDPEGKGRALSEQENSAAEGLLGLSEIDGRRKSLRQKKKPRTMGEYEMGAIEGVEDETEGDGQAETADGEKGNQSSPGSAHKVLLPDNALTLIQAGGTPAQGSPVKRGRGRPPKFNITTNRVQNFLANLGLPVKRGRGRPRRNPPPGGMMPGPAFIIPSPSGNLMMAPIQGVDLKNLQKSSQLSNILPKPRQAAPPATAAVSTGVPTSIIIENEDGTQTHIMTSDIGASLSGGQGIDVSAGQGDANALAQAGQELEGTEPMLEGDDQEDEEDEEEEEDGEEEEDINTSAQIEDAAAAAAAAVEHPRPYSPPALIVRADPITIIPVEDTVDAEGTTSQTAADKENVPDSSPEKEDQTPTAIIQLPKNLVPLLMPRKDPVKIGLRATERDLAKLKCSKCSYQAYYEKQYQAHIKSHGTDINSCKCCNFVSFTEEELLEHFKDSHPKCICLVCNFMSEHAYVIKRHMMRHDPKGCECEICGKTYKDQYILKMHIKMVHMPAEVLFECTVCSKKFTRKAHLKRHLRIHDPEKPFKCPHCDYRGCERSDITKHLLIHEEPKHVCEVCGKAFRHIKNKELHVKRHKGQRDYKCGVCDFYGYTFTDIRKHIERIHSSDSKTIMCDKCGTAFKTDSALREHQLKHCEVMWIEKALAEGREEPTTIHLPPGTQLGGADGQQLLTVDGNQVNITVEQVALPDEVVSVSLPGTQIMESEISEGHLVEQAIVEHHLVAPDGDPDGGVMAVAQDDDMVPGTTLHMTVEDGEDEEIIDEEEVELSAVQLVDQSTVSSHLVQVEHINQEAIITMADS